MLDFIKKFKDLVPEVVQLVLMGVIVGYTLAFRVVWNAGFWNALSSFLPLLLISASAFLLVLFKKSLAGHSVMLLALYINGLTIFIGALFNLQFSPFNYAPGFTPQIFINLVIFLYLALLVVSYVLAGSIQTRKISKEMLIIGALLFVYVWVLQSFFTALIAIMLPVIALLIGADFPALLLMLSIVIEEPFDFINDAVNKTLGWRDLTYYFYFLGALFFIYLFSVKIYKVIKNKAIQE